MYTKLSVFDFDSTLVNTPMESDEVKKEWEDYHGKEWPYLGWWTREESLDMDVWDMSTNPDVIRDYKRESANEDTMVIMLTGRVNTLEPQVKAILRKFGLTFHKYLLKREGQLTDISKMGYMAKILDNNPTIKSIEMWDDRVEHAPVFEKWGKWVEHIDKVKFKLNRVIPNP